VGRNVVVESHSNGVFRYTEYLFVAPEEAGIEPRAEPVRTHRKTGGKGFSGFPSDLVVIPERNVGFTAGRRTWEVPLVKATV
jgi:hypothetical protein